MYQMMYNFNPLTHEECELLQQRIFLYRGFSIHALIYETRLTSKVKKLQTGLKFPNRLFDWYY